MADQSKVSAALVSNESSNDKLRPVLDIMTTTERGVLRTIFEEYFKENAFDGKNSFMGQVLKGSDIDLNYNGSSDYMQMALENLTGESVRQRCKVKIFGVDDSKLTPCSFGEYEDDEIIIDSYPDAFYEAKNGDPTVLYPGDIVKVQFEEGNISSRIITYKYSSYTSNEAISTPIGPKNSKRCEKRKIGLSDRLNRPRAAQRYNGQISATGWPIRDMSSQHKDFLNRGLYGRYLTEIANARKDFQNVSQELILAVIAVESGFEPDSQGRGSTGKKSGAVGLMQIILSQLPYIAKLNHVIKGKQIVSPLRRRFNERFKPGNKEDRTGINPSDPAQNIWIGTAVLDECLSRYGNDVERALVAYNSGLEIANYPDWKSRLSNYQNGNGSIGEAWKYVPAVLEFKRLIENEKPSS